MLNSIGIKNFKCFNNNMIKLNKASLLLGSNSGGKSSLIQALLISKMSIDRVSKKNAKTLDLITNQYGLNLWSFDEVIYEDADEDFFTIKLNNDENEAILEFKPTDDGNVVSLNVSGNVKEFINKVIFLSAERSISKYQKNGDINDIKLGERNEYLGYILEKGQKKSIKVDKNRNYWGNAENDFLDFQINNWLNYVLPNNKVAAKNTGESNYISLLFGDKTNLHQSNIGYGVSFVLPIIIAGLTAKKDSILIIENPELHLHPKAQSNIASFLAVVAAAGVQIVIETHSEHIVNGFRKSILDEKNPIKDSDLTINYFNVDKICIVDEILLNKKVEITCWPEGFMDQEEKDLFEIRKMRLKK